MFRWLNVFVFLWLLLASNISWVATYEVKIHSIDPQNIRQRKIGSSALEDIPYDFSKPWWNPGNLGAGYLAADSEYMGTPFDIMGSWTTKITGSILKDSF
jgi:hypothetical protein